jgi:uncharacterized protein
VEQLLRHGESRERPQLATSESNDPHDVSCPFCKQQLLSPVREVFPELPVVKCSGCDANILILPHDRPQQDFGPDHIKETETAISRKSSAPGTSKSGLFVQVAFTLLSYFLLLLFGSWAFDEAKKRYDPYDIDEHLYSSFILEAQGWTKLHLAAAQGDEDAVRQILNETTQIDPRNQRGSTPLYEAAKRGQVGTMTLLIGHNANMEAKSHYGFTPLFPAIQRGHLKAVELLIVRGAQINARCDCGATALYEAVKWGQTDVVTFLIKHGAAVNAKVKGQTALAYAEEHDLPDIIEILRQSGGKTFKESEKLVERGEGFFKEERWNEALGSFNEAITIDPESIPAYSNRAATWIKKGDLDPALADYRRVLQMAPTHFDTYLSMSWIYAQRQQWDSGIELWSELIKLQPGNGKAYFERAHHASFKHDNKKTHDDLSQSCSLGYTDGCAMLKHLGGL